MNTKMLCLGLAPVIPSLFALQAAQAQVTVSTPPAAVFLQPATPVAGVPGEFAFTGEIINASAATIFLNGDELSPVAPTTSLVPDLTFDDGPFYDNAPTSLTPFNTMGSTYAGPLFNLTIAPDARPGTYSYTYNILGGTDGNAEDVIASTAPFTVTIPASTPEPSALASLMLGGLGLAALGLRARRRAATA